jgi:hypothetical protein
MRNTILSPLENEKDLLSEASAVLVPVWRGARQPPEIRVERIKATRATSSISGHPTIGPRDA